MKNIFTLLAVLLCFTACTSDDEHTKGGIKITTDTDHITLKIGETYTLEYTITHKIKKEDLFADIDLDDWSVARIVGGDYNSYIIVEGNEAGETDLIIDLLGVKKIVKVTVSNKYDLEKYYREFCLGYRVKDTTNLKIIATNSSISQIDEHVYLCGSRGNKLWIGKFDPSSKEQLAEYKTNQSVSFTRKIHTGYDNYVEKPVTYIKLNTLYEIKNGWVADLVFTNMDIIARNRTSLLLFNEGSRTKEYFYTNEYDNILYKPIQLIKWYNNSFLGKIDLSGENNYKAFTCFNSNGEIISTSQGDFPGNNVVPVSYDNYITVSKSYLYGSRDYDLAIYLSIASLSDTKKLVEKVFNYKTGKGSDFKLTHKVINVVNSVYTIQVDVVYYSGYKITYYYQIDTQNKEISEKNL